MRYLVPSTLACFLALLPAAAKEAEYKPADQNFYLRASVLKAEPSAVILGPGAYREKDGSYFITPHHKAPKEIYVTVVKDWLEPVTPPNMPASLGVAPDVMQIRELQGDVQVALPDNPTNFTPATESLPIPNGTVVKTGPDGTAAVLFGGIDSARLTPGTEALVQQTVTPELRSTRIDLRAGAVFSKVGLRPGEKQDYQVHTPFGVAAAKGTDFVCVTLADRTDVWIAQGTVEFDQPNGQMVGKVKAEGKTGLKLIRFPLMTDAHQAMEATAQTMTSAISFIEKVNEKVKTLRDQTAQGTKLTPQEKKYLSLLKQVPCLIRLTLVEPPAPPVPPPAPVETKPEVPETTEAPAPSAAAAPSGRAETKPEPPAPAAVPAPEPAEPAAAPVPAASDSVPLRAQPVTLPTAAPAGKPSVIDLNVHPDGRVDFEGARLKPEALQARLDEKPPGCSVIISGVRKTSYTRMRQVIQACREAGITDISFAPEFNGPTPRVEDYLAAPAGDAPQAKKAEAAPGSGPTTP